MKKISRRAFQRKRQGQETREEEGEEAVTVTPEERLMLSIYRCPWSHWRAGMPEGDMRDLERIATEHGTDPRILWLAWSVGMQSKFWQDTAARQKAESEDAE